MKQKTLILLGILAISCITLVGCGKTKNEKKVVTNTTNEITNVEEKDDSSIEESETPSIEVDEDENSTETNEDEVSIEVNGDEVPEWNGLDIKYEYNEMFDKFAVITVDVDGEEIIGVVSAMADNSKFECHFDKDDKEYLVEVTFNDNEYVANNEEVQDIAIDMCKQLVEKEIWLNVEKDAN